MFETYTRRDTTAVIPFLDRDTILMILQEQPGRREPFWDVPGGVVDTGETTKQAAVRELAEETGYRAERMELWNVCHFEGMMRFDEALYVAKDLLRGSETHPDQGERIQLKPMKWPEVMELCFHQKIRRRDAALALLAMHFDPSRKQRLDQFFQT